jgi:hypothetical protein
LRPLADGLSAGFVAMAVIEKHTEVGCAVPDLIGSISQIALLGHADLDK